MTEISRDVLAQCRLVNDSIENAPTMDGVRSSASMRITSRQLDDRRVRISGSVYSGIHRMRASGKSFHYDERQMAFSIARTHDDLVVIQQLHSTFNRNSTTHVFADDTQALRRLLTAAVGSLLNGVDGGPRDNTTPIRVEASTLEALTEHNHNLTPRIIADIVEDPQAQVLELIGELPDAQKRFPMLPHVGTHALRMTGHSYFLDASDFRQVAANAFGVTRCRKPLTRQVERWSVENRMDDLGMLNWFRLFRGLVPVDWIIEAMAATPTGVRLQLGALHLDLLRQVLRRTPQPVLRRILAEPFPQIQRILHDTASQAAGRDLDLLPGLISARGQKRVRGAQDLENLVMSIPTNAPRFDRRSTAGQALVQERRHLAELRQYNERIARPDAQITWEQWRDPQFRAQSMIELEALRREQMAAEERRRMERAEQHRLERLAKEADRAAWAKATTKTIDGLTVGGLKLVVAKDSQTLTQWGASLNNCIGGYSRELGLDVFAAVLDAAGKVRLNIQITENEGITQFLGANNRDAARELGAKDAQQVLDTLVAQAIPVCDWALGLEGLTLPDASLVS